MDATTAYEELLNRSRERALIGSVSSLLGWDEQTYMPRAGAAYRGEQMALLAGLHHDRATAPKLGALLAVAEGSDLAGGDTPSAANLREWRRQYDRATKLPRSLVEELARATTLGQQAWADARKAADFARFRPQLATIVDLKRQEAACLAPGGAPYDALLDEYEPGATGAALAPLFAALRDELVPLVEAIAAAPRQPNPSALRGEFPAERQRIFCEAAASAVGFDFDRGRLDTTEHPFCTGIGPGDTRITTRWDLREFTDGFFSVLHEVGHGLYDQGLDPAAHGTPMGEAVSLGIHESQSRLWENAVGRCRAFWSHWLPLARRIFHLKDADLDAVHFAVNRVGRSLIRVQADEVTYNLHVFVRFELERALLAGDLAVADVPAAWNDRYREYLGIIPANDAEGCLQDIHWSAGLIGYFPTYTLGNLYAAQLYDRADADLGGLADQFARGEFAPLLGWLRDKIHVQGQRYRPAELIEHATGTRPDHRPLVRALREKYGAIYGI